MILDPVLVVISDFGKSKDVGYNLGVITHTTISRDFAKFIDGDGASVASEVQGLFGYAGVPKEIGVTKNFECGLIVQENVRRGGGALLLMEGFRAPSIGNTHVIFSWCGEGVFQVTLGVTVGYHIKTFKEVTSIGVYIESRHESVHVVVGRFLGVDVFMRLSNIGPVRSLVGKVS